MATPKVSKMHARVQGNTDRLRVLENIEKKPPVNTFWDDAQNLYRTSMDGLQQSHIPLLDHIQHVMGSPELRAKIENEPLLTQNILLLGKDVQTHIELLNSIYATHKNFVGGTVTPDEHMAVMEIHGKYHDAIELYQANILPTVAHIFEQLKFTDDIIEQSMRSELERKMAEAQDTRVITDVEVKEVKHG